MSESGTAPDLARDNAWPADQAIERWLEPSVVMTTFEDTAAYHPGLVRYILDRLQWDRQAKSWNSTVGGAKLYHLDQWDCPEAALIHGRATSLFKQVMGCDEAVVDISWTTLYREGDYCAPHSHVRATASLVYFLQLGEDDDGEVPNGRFCFADPRVAACCRAKEGYMTTPCAPLHRAGTLLMFPGQLVHTVTPYRGETPRITLSWNINQRAIAGSPLPDEPA